MRPLGIFGGTLTDPLRAPAHGPRAAAYARLRPHPFRSRRDAAASAMPLTVGALRCTAPRRRPRSGRARSFVAGRPRAHAQGPFLHDRHARELPRGTSPVPALSARRDGRIPRTAGMAPLGELLDFAHVVVAHRPGWRAPDSGFTRRSLARKRRTARPGCVMHAEPGRAASTCKPVTQLEISSTDLRSFDRRRPSTPKLS